MNNNDQKRRNRISEIHKVEVRTRGSSRALVGSIAAALAMAGCTEPGPNEGPTAPESPSVEKTDPTVGAGDLVDVASDGTRFDPPVPTSRIPDDVWTCEMNGQSHYASRTKGDGKCPVCSMDLVHKHAGYEGHEGREGRAGHQGRAGHRDSR